MRLAISGLRTSPCMSRSVTALLIVLGFAPTVLAAPPPPPIAGTTNIALGASTSGLSPGWGGGSFPNFIRAGVLERYGLD